MGLLLENEVFVVGRKIFWEGDIVVRLVDFESFFSFGVVCEKFYVYRIFVRVVNIM